MLCIFLLTDSSLIFVFISNAGPSLALRFGLLLPDCDVRGVGTAMHVALPATISNTPSRLHLLVALLVRTRTTPTASQAQRCLGSFSGA